MVKNQQNKKKVIFVNKIPKTFDFKSQQPKKSGHIFLGLFTWNHPTTNHLSAFNLVLKRFSLS